MEDIVSHLLVLMVDRVMMRKSLMKLIGSKGSKNFIIDDKNTGVMYRESPNIEDTSIVTGTLTRVTINWSLVKS